MIKPLLLTGLVSSVNVNCSTRGGGNTGQAGACRLAIARAIADRHPEKRAILKKGAWFNIFAWDLCLYINICVWHGVKERDYGGLIAHLLYDEDPTRWRHPPVSPLYQRTHAHTHLQHIMAFLQPRSLNAIRAWWNAKSLARRKRARSSSGSSDDSGIAFAPDPALAEERQSLLPQVVESPYFGRTA